jgi:hypothetical protein
MDVDELRELTKKIIDNPRENITDLGLEKLAELKKYVNPLGTVTANKRSYSVMSIFNMNESYRKKYLTTSMIAFIYRLLEEYEPEAELEKARKYHHEHPEITEEQREERLAEITSTTRRIIRAFLNRNYSYDIDRHIRGGHKQAAVKKGVEEYLEQAKVIEEKIASHPDKLFSFLRSNVLLANSQLKQVDEQLTSINEVLLDDSLSLEDKQTLLIRTQLRIQKISAEFGKIAEPLEKADTVHAWTINPPADLFYHFDRFITNHYEQLRDITDTVYNERSDIDDIVIHYDSFETDSDAKDFVAQHDGEFKQEPLIIENNGITLLGPFKENKAKVNYYNKNTQILKEMTEQVEMDQKLGKDIIEKRVKDKKKKNIDEMGPDDPGLKQYREALGTIDKLGGKKGLTQQEQDEYAKSISLRDDMEVPDGAIQTDVFYTDEDGKLKSKKLYTQAEAPLHLQKGSQFAEKYQAKKNI